MGEDARGRVKRRSLTIIEQFTVAARAMAWRIFRIPYPKSNRIACFHKGGDFSHGLAPNLPFPGVPRIGSIGCGVAVGSGRDTHDVETTLCGIRRSLPLGRHCKIRGFWALASGRSGGSGGTRGARRCSGRGVLRKRNTPARGSRCGGTSFLAEMEQVLPWARLVERFIGQPVPLLQK
jgi:hypothetical protein